MTVNSGVELPRSRPESQGIASSGIVAFVNEMKRLQVELHSLMVLRHGRVVAEGWWSPYKPELPHSMFSLSKSFTSTAIGLAISEGKLSLDDKVAAFFPELVKESPSPAYLEQMTVHHLLSMSTGHSRETLDQESRKRSDWAKTFFQAEIEYEPGTRFVYNSGATYMLSVILQTVTGSRLLDYLQPRLFKPLGFTGVKWEVSPDGYNTGGWGLSIITEDIAKFGQLYLQGGIWQGQQLVPEEWIRLATSKQIESGEDPDSHWSQGYGYQFWRCKDGAYRADGALGQFCVVMPREDAVVVTTCGTQQTHLVLEAVWTHLRAAMTDQEALPDGADDYKQLTGMLERLTLEPPRHLFDSIVEKRVTGRTCVFEEKDGSPWIKSTTSFGELLAEVALHLNNGDVQTIRLGRGSWVRNVITLPGAEPQAVMAAFTWEEERVLLLTLRFVETPLCVTIKAVYDGDRVTLQQTDNQSPAEAEPLFQSGRLEK